MQNVGAAWGQGYMLGMHASLLQCITDRADVKIILILLFAVALVPLFAATTQSTMVLSALVAGIVGALTGGGTVIYSVLQAVGIIKTTAYVSATLAGIAGAVFGTGAGASAYHFLFWSRSNENQEVILVHRIWILVPAIIMLQYAAIMIRHLLQQQVQVDNTQQSRFQTRCSNNNNSNSSNKWSWLCFYLCLATSFIFEILFLIDLHMLQLQSVFISGLVCLTVYHVVIMCYVMLTR